MRVVLFLAARAPPVLQLRQQLCSRIGPGPVSRPKRTAVGTGLRTAQQGRGGRAARLSQASQGTSKGSSVLFCWEFCPTGCLLLLVHLCSFGALFWGKTIWFGLMRAPGSSLSPGAFKPLAWGCPPAGCSPGLLQGSRKLPALGTVTVTSLAAQQLLGLRREALAHPALAWGGKWSEWSAARLPPLCPTSPSSAHPAWPRLLPAMALLAQGEPSPAQSPHSNRLLLALLRYEQELV